MSVHISFVQGGPYARQVIGKGALIPITQAAYQTYLLSAHSKGMTKFYIEKLERRTGYTAICPFVIIHKSSDNAQTT